MSKVLTFLINLDRSTDRLARMQAQFDRLGLSVERIPAVDGLAVPDDLAPYFAHIQLGKKPIIEDGSIGCYASHLQALRRVVETRAPYALVLEDDAGLPENFHAVIDDTLHALPRGWDFVQLSRRHQRAFRPLASLPFGGTLVRYSRVPAGTSGYLISQAGALKLLNPNILRFWAIDTDTRRTWLFGLDSYGVVPNPFRDQGLETTIRNQRGSARRGLPRPTPYSWTNLPFHTPAAFAWNVRKLGVAWWLRCFIANCSFRSRAAIVAKPPRQRSVETAPSALRSRR